MDAKFDTMKETYDEAILNLNTNVIENNESIINVNEQLKTDISDLSNKVENHTHSYNSLTDIPTSFTPSEHNHDTLYSKLNHTHTD